MKALPSHDRTAGGPPPRRLQARRVLADALLTWGAALLALLAGSTLLLAPAGAAARTTTAALPERLHDTGLHAPGAPDQPGPGVQPFEPRYALWSDGAQKKRWIRLPPGQSIDTRAADAWIFPPGTRLWKEFARDGRRIETRYVERTLDGRWRFAAYVWDEEGREARLAPAAGLRALPVAQALGGSWDIPSRADCLACHGGTPVPVLGYSAVQLGAAAVRAVTAATPAPSAALGYLHANCAHCHNDSTHAVPVPLNLALRAAGGATDAAVLRALLAPPLRYRTPALPAGTALVSPGRPEASVLLARMRSRAPHMQMPPLGTRHPDPEGLALIERWIANDLAAPAHHSKEP